MARLSDRIVNGRERLRVSPLSEEFFNYIMSSREMLESYTFEEERLLESLKHHIPPATFVTTDDVSRSVFEDLELGIPPTLENVCVLPRWENTFAETSVTGDAGYNSIGALVVRQDNSHDNEGWIIKVFLITEIADIMFVVPILWHFPLNHRGELVFDDNGGIACFPEILLPHNKAILESENLRQLRREFSQLIMLFFIAFGYANQKPQSIEVEGVSRQVRRQAIRRGEEVLEHHIICIDPDRVVRRRQCNAGVGKNAEHDVCGHPKTFTADKPLLGKHVGTFFWKPQTRGSRDKGRIEKKYIVKAPKKK